jgi:hypothetical protein
MTWRALRRLPRLYTKAEDLWVTSKVGKPDAAYMAADMLVDAAMKCVGVLVLVVGRAG